MNENDNENKNNSFEHVFDQINDLLSFIKGHKLNPSEEAQVSPEIEKRLESLNKKVSEFAKLSEDIVRFSGISEEELKKRRSGISDELPPNAKNLIDRGNVMKDTVEKMNDKLEEALKNVPLKDRLLSALSDTPKEEKLLDDKEYGKKRRSKFKRFGSDKNWKPL